ncbi:unnamed protein product, partial [Durusdinium trenchii]
AALPSSRFQVVQALPWWHNAPKEEHGHGSTLPSWASHCLRSQPDVHRCRGFFLCRLDRTAPEPEEPAQNAAPRKRRKRRRPDRAEKTADVGGRVRPPSEAPKVQAKKSKKGKALGLRIHSAWARLLRTGPLRVGAGKYDSPMECLGVVFLCVCCLVPLLPQGLGFCRGGSSFPQRAKGAPR